MIIVVVNSNNLHFNLLLVSKVYVTKPILIPFYEKKTTIAKKMSTWKYQRSSITHTHRINEIQQN